MSRIRVNQNVQRYVIPTSNISYALSNSLPVELVSRNNTRSENTVLTTYKIQSTTGLSKSQVAQVITDIINRVETNRNNYNYRWDIDFYVDNQHLYQDDLTHYRSSQGQRRDINVNPYFITSGGDDYIDDYTNVREFYLKVYKMPKTIIF